jgi:cobalt/nickel transport system permease protein
LSVLAQEAFSQGDSLLHQADPRVKIVLACALACAVAPGRSLEGALAALGAGLVLAGAARLPLGSVARRLLVVNGFTAFLWLVLPFTWPGDPAWALGPLTATRQGLAQALLVTLKCNALLLALLALVSTSRIADLGDALRRLRVPDKACCLLLFTFRYVHVVADEYQRLARAARMRGFVPGNNLHTYRTYAHLLGMILVRSADRAERVRQAMALRGFQGRFHPLRPMGGGKADPWLLLAGLAAVGVLARLSWG